uniref:ROK family protein n=1 Tax=Steinernema glaseri TaxID=37863 RepID=A0A1I8AVZ7_9BILA
TEPASLTWYWLRSSRRRKAERMMVSSSTIRICGIDSILSTVSVHSGRRYDMTRQGHTDPGATLALGIGRAVDGFEQPVHDALRNAAAFVLDDQVDGVLAGFALDPYRRAGRRCIAGVGQQVDEYLRQALRIAVDPVLWVAQ